MSSSTTSVGRTVPEPAAVKGQRPATAQISNSQIPDATASAPPVHDLSHVRNVAFYLPVDLLNRLKQVRRSRELTYADLLIEAAAAHLDDIASSFTSELAPVVAQNMPVRARRRATEPAVQMQIRLDGHQIAWLNEQVRQLHAPSRTALVLKLFEVHLA